MYFLLWSIWYTIEYPHGLPVLVVTPRRAKSLAMESTGSWSHERRNASRTIAASSSFTTYSSSSFRP